MSFLTNIWNKESQKASGANRKGLSHLFVCFSGIRNPRLFH